MSLIEIEKQIENLSPDELSHFADWFEHFFSDQWDKRIEQDILDGRLDHLAKKADQDFESGYCKPL